MTFEEKALAAGGHLADDVAAAILEEELWSRHNQSLDGLAGTLLVEDTALD